MNIAVYCGSGHGDRPEYAQAARQLGAWMATNGHGLVYGGSSIGLMGAVSAAVMQGGGQAIGVEPRFFIEMGVEQHGLTELIVVDTMSQRKDKMIQLSDAFVALPGGVGTLEEISEIMSRIRLNLTQAPCVLLNLDGFYDHLAAMLDVMTAHGFVNPHERDAIYFAPTVEDACAHLAAYAAAHAGENAQATSPIPAPEAAPVGA